MSTSSRRCSSGVGAMLRHQVHEIAVVGHVRSSCSDAASPCPTARGRETSPRCGARTARNRRSSAGPLTDRRSGPLTFDQTFVVRAHEAHEALELRAIDGLAHIGPAHVIDDHAVGSEAKNGSSSGSSCASKYTTTCQPSGAMRACDLEQSSVGVTSTSRLTKLKRTPRTPASCSSAARASVTSRFTVATPRARSVRAAQRVDQRAVVRAVAGGLHDHVALEAQEIAQREQLFLRRVAWACTCARGA